MIINYINGNTCFWVPEIHNLFNSDDTGRIILEFPLFHQLTAFIVRNMPFATPVIFRWFMYAITVYSYYYAFKLADTYLNNKKLSILVSLFTFIIPVVVFYCNTYMVDIPAMALAFPAIYFFEKNLKKRSIWNIILFTICLSLSGLLRLPVIIFPLSYFGARLFKRKDFLQLFWTIPSFVIIIAWYLYVQKNNTYNYTYPPNLTYNFLPEDQVADAWYGLCTWVIYQFGWVYRSLAFYIVVMVFLIIYRKKIKSFWMIVLAFMLTGSFIYGFLWFGALKNHDYYMIPFVPLYFIIWLIVFQTAMQTRIMKYVILVAYILIGINTISTFDNMNMRTFHNKVGITNIFSGKEETGFWNFAAVEDLTKWSDFRMLSPYNCDVLEKNGIKPCDTAICDFDGSPTYCLALLNLNGWTSFNSTFNSIEDYKKYVQRGAKYLFCSRLLNPTLNSESESYLKKNHLFTFGNIEVYNIEHLK